MVGPILMGSMAVKTEPRPLDRRRRRSAYWFYWISGVSVVNTMVALAGQHWRFIVGLGTTQVAHGLATRAGRGRALALLLDLLLIGGFALLGYLALQGHDWVFPVGIGVYALDGLIFFVARNWVGLGFHVFVLVMLCRGFLAVRQLERRSL